MQYTLEHVLATLLNDVLFRYHQRSNFTTRSNIEYVLSQQTTAHWRLGACDITRYFHYKWENENGLLGPLFSIAEPFDVPYVWTFDTQSYPWTLNLVTPSDAPTAEVRFGKNLASIEREVDPSNIVNRLYALGAGEGVNQLTIADVNDGLTYVEDTSSIATYGLGQYVWVDRRFEDDLSLLASAKAFLKEWAVPHVSYTIKAVDLSSLTGLSIDKFTVGKVVRVTDPEIGTFDARIVSERKADIYGAPGDIDIGLANTKDNVGKTIADVERRQEINEVYSQGATNILSFTYQDNADASIPASIPFYIDDDVVNVNTIELSFRTERFRAYSQATKGGGAIVKSTSGGGSIVKSTGGGGGTVKSTSSGGGSTATSSSGGGTTATSSSGGGTSTSTQSGGGSTQTAQAGGDHRHVMFTPSEAQGPFEQRVFQASNGLARIEANSSTLTTAGSSGTHSHGVSVPSHSHEFSTPNHTHSVTVPPHTHSVAIPGHTHEIDLPNHTHDVDLPDHTHDVDLPDHTHEVDHKIVELNTLPTSAVIRVDGNTVPHTSINGNRINLVNYMSKDSDGKITRGRHEVTVTPNGLGRIEADLILRVFIQSQLGGNF